MLDYVKKAVPIDLKSILDRYTNIRCIVINSGTAKKYFDKYLLQFVNDDIKLVYTPSTSGRNARSGVDQLVDEFKRMLI